MRTGNANDPTNVLVTRSSHVQPIFFEDVKQPIRSAQHPPITHLQSHQLLFQYGFLREVDG